MKDFIYLQPKTLAEASALRVEHGETLKVMNGGTDIVIQLRDKLIAPAYVMDIKKIPGLSDIVFSEKEGLLIGACATMNELGGNEYVKKHYPFLAEAALSVGSKQVRNRASCIGNIVNASPLCDTGTPLYVCDAIVLTSGSNGKREIPIRDFITFVRKTTLAPDEIVTGIKVPYQSDIMAIFTKISRREQVDLSTVCGTVAKIGVDYRLAFGAVAPTPVRLYKTEAFLAGKTLTPELIIEAAKLASGEVTPISDIRASKEYRAEIVEVITERSLRQLI